MKKPLNKFRYVVHQCAGPVHAIGAIFHWMFHPVLPHFVKRKHVQFVCGFGVILLGVWVAKLAALCGHGFFHLLVDGTGYTIHALGAAPIIKAACDGLGVDA